ncbi:MAG: bifunctional DNA-formamidopyrimidine glycosylase/DNA-(apurinic or apyrimidinic site) lyase [Acidobacteriota bacterium]
MPELPEVEVLRRSLEPHLVGDRIESLWVGPARLREAVDETRLRRRVRGRRVVGLRRRAKYLWIDLEADESVRGQHATLVVHLGMSGRLLLVPVDTPREKHEHVSFALASGRRLRFVDPRRFGLVFALRADELAGDRHFAHLGAEPLSQDWTGEVLQAAARGRRGPVKAFLMDARVVVGVGNIYASEALFRAGIHPKRSVARLALARWRRLAEAVQEVLARAIDQGGTTLNDFADGEGNSGYFQVALAVYGREGGRCPRCDGTVRRIVQTGRSTFYCPGCQR